MLMEINDVLLSISFSHLPLPSLSFLWTGNVQNLFTISPLVPICHIIYGVFISPKVYHKVNMQRTSNASLFLSQDIHTQFKLSEEEL